jgi:sulfonate transport system substrate-binding protein
MNQQNARALRIGGVPEHFNLPWQLAIDSGEAMRCGLPLVWRDYSTGTGAMLADLAANNLDLAVLLTEGAALGLAQSLPVEAISLYTTSPLIWGVHVAPESPFGTLGDLRDARFAISRPGSGSHLMSLALSLEQGWPADAIEFVVVDNLSGAIAALGENRADVLLWEHFTTEPEIAARRLRRIDDFVAPWAAWVLCASSAAWQRDAPAIRRLLDIAAARADRLARDPEASALIAERFGLELAAVGQWLERTAWVSQATPPDEALAAARAMLEKAGAI